MKTPVDDIIITTLKSKWFELAKKENYPHTTSITKELDNLTQAIRELQAKSPNATASV